MNFFNRATNAVEAMGKNVSKAAKDNVEIVRCSSAIDSCEEKIKTAYMEIGKRYYNSEEEPSREMFADLYEIIQANQKQIEDLRNRLQELKGVIICKVCGTELSRDAKFCRNCGSQIEHIAEVPVSTAVCWNCHSPLTGNEKFCGSCGAKIEKEQPEQMKTEEIEETEAEQPEMPLICPVCGGELKDTDVFCKLCGSPVK